MTVFTYLNPSVRKKLISEGKFQRIDLSGALLGADTLPPHGEPVISLLGPIPLPLSLQDFECQANWYAAVRSAELDKVEDLAEKLRRNAGQYLFATLASPMAVNSVLIIGNPLEAENPLVRVHSNCLTGDVFGSRRCECGVQLASAVKRITQEESGGLVIYMAGHEGRGIGLWAKAATYLLQDSGENTYQANESLGLPPDSRDFTDAAALILHFLGDRPFRLMTNNPKKIQDLEQAGLTRMQIEKLVVGVNDWNRHYLSAKQQWGHRILDVDLEGS